MQFWRLRSSSLPVVVVALIALLMLGTVQLIWIGQLSQSARERMEESARAGAAQIGESFDRELVRAYIDLQMDSTTLRDQRWAVYRRQVEAWQAVAPYPSMVGKIYLAQIGRSGTLALYEYDRQAGEFHPRTWTSEFAGLLGSLDETYRTRRIQGELIVGTSPPAIEEAMPALVIPVARPWLLGTQPAGEPDLLDADVMIGGGIFTRSRRPCLNCEGDGPLFAYTVVTLDKRALARDVLPSLAKRHLGGLSDYHLTVVRQGDPRAVIYQSDSGAPPADQPADATASLLTLRLDEFNRLMADIERTQPAQEAGGRQPMRIAIGVVDRAQEDGSSVEHGWELRLNHRAGSLEAAVAALRNRNLLISFGSLLLLGVSLAMILVSSRRAHRLARQKVEFVAAISHELRTPLSVICSAGANLADGLVDRPERAHQYGALIAREGRRLTELVEQAMAFSAAQAERRTPELRQTDARAVVERALVAFRLQVEEQGVALEYWAEPDLPPIMADIEGLQRAVHNLIANALKYGAEGRWLSVEVRAEGAGRRQCVAIRVADRGPGIAPADLPHIFKPFYRGADAVDAQVYGSGLGLSLVKLAVEQHGGTIAVDSARGQGSAFTIRIPAAQAAQARAASVRGTP